MFQESNPNICSFSDIMYVENLLRGEHITHRLKNSGWIIDYALENDIDINGDVLRSGFCRLSFCDRLERTIKGNRDCQCEFLSVRLHENPYMKLNFSKPGYQNLIGPNMAYPILKLISALKVEDSHICKNMAIKCYIQLLTFQFATAAFIQPTMKFTVLKRIFFRVQKLTNFTKDFPLPSELAEQCRCSKLNFQKGCLTLFGQSAQKIIQHLKMNQAYESIVMKRKNITAASIELGYNHAPNLITAFHHHFAITPMEAVQSRCN